MARRNATSHVVMCPPDGKCLHCGETERVPLPMPLRAFSHWGKYFVEKHRHCKPQPPVSP